MGAFNLTIRHKCKVIVQLIDIMNLFLKKALQKNLPNYTQIQSNTWISISNFKNFKILNLPPFSK